VLYPSELRARALSLITWLYFLKERLVLKWSGGLDSNQRTFRSQTGRSTKLSYRPSVYYLGAAVAIALLFGVGGNLLNALHI
jgi:hypothetical protein